MAQAPWTTIEWSGAYSDLYGAPFGLLRIPPPGGVLGSAFNACLALMAASPQLAVVLQPAYYASRSLTFDGAVSLVARGVMAAGVGPFSITPERSAAVAFTPPLAASGYTVLALQPSAHGSTFWLFVEPFTLGVWGLIFLVFCVGALSWWLLERSSPFGTRHMQAHRGARREAKCAAVAYKMTLSMLEKEVHVPAALSARCVSVGVFAFMLLMLAAYDASLIAIEVAEATASTTPMTFQSLQVSPGPIGVLNGSSVAAWVRTNSKPATRALSDYLVPLPSYEAIVAGVESGALLAGLGSTQVLVYAVANESKCLDVIVAGDETDGSLFALPVTPGAPFLAALSAAAAVVQFDGGVTALLQTDYVDVVSAGCPSVFYESELQSGSVEPLFIGNIAGQLIVFLCFIAASFITLAVEFTVFRFNERDGLWRSLNILLGHDYHKPGEADAAAALGGGGPEGSPPRRSATASDRRLAPAHASGRLVLAPRLPRAPGSANRLGDGSAKSLAPSSWLAPPATARSGAATPVGAPPLGRPDDAHPHGELIVSCASCATGFFACTHAPPPPLPLLSSSPPPTVMATSAADARGAAAPAEAIVQPPALDASPAAPRPELRVRFGREAAKVV